MSRLWINEQSNFLLKKEKTINLKLIVTGSHLEKKYGFTLMKF